jgi:hypothetical protein
VTPDTAISLRSENADNNSLDTVHAGLHELAGYLENIVLLGDQIILNVGGGRFDCRSQRGSYTEGDPFPPGGYRNGSPLETYYFNNIIRPTN